MHPSTTPSTTTSIYVAVSMFPSIRLAKTFLDLHKITHKIQISRQAGQTALPAEKTLRCLL